MQRIERLSTEVVEKIAAGEVVERPASVVKELIENSIDAGASRITIEIVEGGTKLMRVTDDGEGILADDLPLAFARHATSKLHEADELFAIRTLGFRGEALPSIAAISRVEATSAVAGELAGARVEIIGGEVGPVRESAARTGTVITVRDLFFNVPVRKKFLKKQATEFARITDIVQRIALTCREIHFELSHNRKSVYVLPAVRDLRERIGAFFGRELAQSLVEAVGDDGYLKLRAWLARHDYTRANHRGVHLFLNRRFVRDRVLSAAVINAYQGLIERGRFPIAFVFVQLDTDQIDVNVHPSKLEVRLRNGARVFTAVNSLIRGRLEIEWSSSSSPEQSGTLDDRRERIRQKIGQFFLRGEAQSRQPNLWSDTHAGRGKGAHPGADVPSAPSGPPRMLMTSSVMQIHDSFILEETDEGFALIDQHALHERILYEETTTRLASRALESQRLLTPEVIEADQTDILSAAEHADLLRKAGFEVTAAGPGSLALHSLPQLLHNEDPGELLRDMLDALGEETGRETEKKLSQVARVIACKGAVKAGQPLTKQEMESILERRNNFPNTATCPHGRPTTMFFSLSELARKFGRS